MSTNEVKEIKEQIQELLTIIDAIRKEVSEIKQAKIQKIHMPVATDELDAVVLSTEEATGTIMDAAEKIMEMASSVECEASENIVGEVMKIFEACSFQDITGQRITKVVKAFKVIETKVNSLLLSLTPIDNLAASGKDSDSTEKPVDENDKESLLNGPGLPGNAMNQDDVDKLLSD